MILLRDAAKFVRSAHKKLRLGESSRQPVNLLRVEWKADALECDWLMRQPDVWDKDLPAKLAEENQTLQALKDALKLRDTIFTSFPAILTAELRMFRLDASGQLELMMTGSVDRANMVSDRVASITMRARLCGFQFSLSSGVLESRPRSS